MLKHIEVYLIGAVLSLGALSGGCASGKQMSSSALPGQSMPGETGETQKAGDHPVKSYVVKPHDCLWTIAGKSSIYGDPFQWPLLYKANRDLIQDPDLIYAHQKLKVEENLSRAQVDQARRLADSTPRYKPHPKRQEKQLVEYF